jgi:hypothetical protein
MNNPPRFVINEVKNPLSAKSKYTQLTKSEKLQFFVSLACYGGFEGKSLYPDPSDPSNRNKAENWFINELLFLGKRDAQELRDIWQCAIEYGDYTRLLFSAIRTLQEKYSNV